MQECRHRLKAREPTETAAAVKHAAFPALRHDTQVKAVGRSDGFNFKNRARGNRSAKFVFL